MNSCLLTCNTIAAAIPCIARYATACNSIPTNQEYIAIHSQAEAASISSCVLLAKQALLAMQAGPHLQCKALQVLAKL